LQVVRMPSAILKIVFRHILFHFLFLMQFRLWRAAAFVSFPIHLFVLLLMRQSHLCFVLNICVCVCVCVGAFVNSTLCGKSYVGDGHCGECLHCGENIVSPQW